VGEGIKTYLLGAPGLRLAPPAGPNIGSMPSSPFFYLKMEAESIFQNVVILYFRPRVGNPVAKFATPCKNYEIRLLN
jgi:hypothetical protein